MGLPRALKAHAANLLSEAEAHYRRAHQQGQVNAIFYQNFGALLKKQGKTAESEKFFEEGLQRYPHHPGILRNYANLLRERKPSYAIELYLSAIRSAWTSEKEADIISECLGDLIDLLRKRELFSWALALIDDSLSYQRPSALMLMNLLLLIDRSGVAPKIQQLVIDAITQYLENASVIEAVTLDFSLASHFLSTNDHKRSITYFESAFQRIESGPFVPQSDRGKLQELVDSNSWNYGCACLALQDLKRGWKLFEHGLRTPADGQQRWQRALVKPFSAKELPLWRGDRLPSQRLLLLEEQAVGDGMMFLSLVPRLLEETHHIGIYLSPRLESIYQRSFANEIEQNLISIYTKNDLLTGRLVANNFDHQIPLGSICQHRFHQVQNYAPRVPMLIADDCRVTDFRNDYLSINKTPKLLVGVSWQGGGRGARIQQKSLSVEMFSQLMLNHPDVRFIDLQYGNTASQINAWKQQGIDIVHDPRVDALKDMDLWLAQVKSCDGVISVANTTIHGAGGLNLPTQCLLSVHSDWRWFVDSSVKKSYWYPSVAIARQSKTHKPSWQKAFRQVSSWLLDGCSMPSGPVESAVR